MKILTILGTRPEIIRLSLIIKKLDQYASKHILVHTGQNFTKTLSEIFFEELSIRQPDYHLKSGNTSVGSQLSTMFSQLEGILEAEKPDKVLLLGDTNSALSAILAERMNIPVFHMEAGNRCFDLRVPEEKNRKVIDAVSTFNLPYTEKSRENLMKEGVPTNRIYISGNPIYEVLKHYEDKIEASLALEKLGLMEREYFLVTIHRAENVDDEKNLTEILKGLGMVAEHYQKRVICSLHPRTASRMKSSHKAELHSLIELHEPFGLFDFIKLQKNAFCVLTDSGTVQEESCLLHVPAVTVRNTTERPETVECGSNVVCGIDAGNILQSVHVMVQQPKDWLFPQGYQDPLVSSKVVKFILGGKRIV